MQNQDFSGNGQTQDPNMGTYPNYYGPTPGQVPTPTTPESNPQQFYAGDSSFNQGYDPNAFYNQTQQATGYVSPDPNLAAQPQYSQDPQNLSFAQPPLYDPNYNPGTSYPTADPYAQQPEIASAAESTFEQPKSGNRFLVIGVVVLILVLMGVAGFIVYSYQDVLFGTSTGNQTSQTTEPAKKDEGQNNNTGNNNQPTNSPNSTVIGCTATAPTRLANNEVNSSPAQKAKIYNETSASCDWLKRSFAGKTGSVDQNTGQCLKPEICGLTVDADGDGLSNILEFNYQADPLNLDTDNDKIADGDEVNVYSTHPLKNDTDGDTYVDSLELPGCYDPNINDTNLPPNDITKGKLTITRQNEISGKIVSNPLHEPTISMLKATGDLNAVNNGFAQCAPATTPTPTGALQQTPASPDPITLGQ